jgi:malate permease and related proteins
LSPKEPILTLPFSVRKGFMHLFLTFLIKLLPLFSLVAIGFVLGRVVKVKKGDIANLLIFFFLPFITFHGMYTTPLTLQALSLPLLFFVLCSGMALLFLWIGRFIWNDNTANLLAFASSYGNYAYFAIPAAIVLFGKQTENCIVLSAIGFIVFSSTVGYFLTALGNFTVRESIIKTLRLPSIYSTVLGFILNFAGVKFGSAAGVDLQALYNEIARDMRGCLSVLGMMLLGVAIAEIRHYKADWKFVGVTFFAQFVVWPVAILGLIFIDKHWLHFYSTVYYQALFLLSLIPIGINLIAYATQLDTQPEKAAFTILLSTLFAMVYIPLMIAAFMGFLAAQ